ncbi:unnamed protein product [Tuber aestivum]|uniref:DUF7708 domain-containing protein n=1 Tax=Tuber aestivum TaxID=59557 RepID=A0A292PXL4_9PEZI|nr:unnamed protein product [Tuber aestivum]
MSSTFGTKILRSHQKFQPFQQQEHQHALVPARRTSLPFEEEKETCSGQIGLIIPVPDVCDEERHATKDWWADPGKLSKEFILLIHGGRTFSTLGPAKQAFEEAIQIFNGTLAKSEKERLDPERATTMADVLEYTNKAKETWENKPRWKKPRKWLERFSTRVTHYSKVMDVLVQHHPEYASLAWGAMKLLFVLVINHETAIKEVAKTLTRISGYLPQADLLSIMYPSDEMRIGVATLYAHIISFLQRATSWYRGGRLSHFFRALWNPFEVSFRELVDDIREQGKRVADLADVGHKLDTRVNRGLIEDLCKKVERVSALVGAGQAPDRRKSMNGQVHCIQMTQREFFELQNRFWASKQDQEQLCQNMFGQLRPLLGYKSPGFENLKISGSLGLPVELDFRGLPKALGRLAVDLEETAAMFSYQIAFIFCSNETVCGYLKSPVDVAKLLVFHVLEHNPHLLLEQRNTLPLDRLQAARTVPDFIKILEDILRFIPSILFVIDSIDACALPALRGDKAECTSNDIQQLIDGLTGLARTFENSVKITFTTRPSNKRLLTPGPLFEKHATKLHLHGGMVGWIDEKRDDFPLPRFRNHTFITPDAVAPREPSDDEPFLKMTTPEGGSISAGTPNKFPLPKRPSWPSNLYSIIRHKCEFRDCIDLATMERTLTTAKFPNPFCGR